MKNPLDMFCTWYMRRQIRKQQKAQQVKVDKERQEVRRKLKDLYDFIKWLNANAFKNRHARKSFWRNVAEGKPVIEDHLEYMISRYKARNEKKKPQPKVQPVPQTPSK